MGAGDGRWSLVNASPDVRHQLAAFPGLHPRPGTRDVPLDTVVLTNADLDHVMGLLVLREALPYRVVSTPWIRDAILSSNAAFRLIEPAWGTALLDETFALDRDGALEARLFPVPGKVPTWLKGVAPNHAETTLGLRVTDRRSGRRLVYAPGIQRLDAGTLAELAEADLRFVDGTFWTADELLAMRPGAPDAWAMGHVPISGEEAASRRWRRYRAARSTSTSTTRTPSSTPGRPRPPRYGRRASRSRATAWSSCRERRGLRGATPAHPRRALSPPPPVQPAHARGRAHPRRDPSLGTQPLLLPDEDPDQGRPHPDEGRGSGLPAPLDPPHPRPRRRHRRRGGLELWLRLAEAVGLAREEVAALRGVLPGVRRACDAYVEFVGSHDLLESVAASLTELRAGALLGARAEAFGKHYPWIGTAGLAYFRSRTVQAPRDAEEGLAFVLLHAVSDEERSAARRRSSASARSSGSSWTPWSGRAAARGPWRTRG